MEIAKANSTNSNEEEILARIEKLKEIDQALTSALQVQYQIQDRCDNLEEYINQNIERTLVSMKACTNSIINEMLKKKENLLKLLKSIEDSIENDETVVKIRDERDWYIKRVEDLESRYKEYSQKASEKKIKANDLEMSMRDLNAKLKSLNIQNMRIQFKLDGIKKRVLPISLQTSPKKQVQIIGHTSSTLSALVSPKGHEPISIKNLKNSILKTKNEIKKIQEETYKSNQSNNISRFFKSCYDTMHDDLIKRLPNKLSFIYKMLTDNSTEASMQQGSLSFNGDYFPNMKIKNQMKRMKEEELENLKFSWKEFKEIDSHKIFIILSVKDKVLEELIKAISVDFRAKKQEEIRKRSIIKSELEFLKLRIRRNEKGDIVSYR
ncbi:unnamed protein product [Blepharisma stoltei]|uniref:Uncharacterized protein n=1 Tax=Blepharisma stoltei TaxID=1481888 RepID=A0AAU9JU83_9CILI|nr:unnamed protein product [Blepharisma stoltei]